MCAGCADGSVSEGRGGFFRQCEGGSGVAAADWMLLRHAAGSTEEGQHVCFHYSPLTETQQI